MIPFLPVGLDLVMVAEIAWRNVINEFLAMPGLAEGIQSVGVGFNTVKGRRRKGLAIQCFVDVKLPKRALRSECRIPPVFKSVITGKEFQTDVLEVGTIELAGNGDARHERPVPGGCAIGLDGDNYVGTMGAVCVATIDGADRLCILSNRHVLHQNNADVVQPAGGKAQADRVGIVASSVPIMYGSNNNAADAALAICAVDGVSPRYWDWRKSNWIEIDGGDINHVSDPVRGMNVEKIGRTTSLTKGRIVATDATSGPITYGNPFPGGQAGFAGCIVIRGSRSAFSQPGDSGSLVYDSATRKPVGLLFAGSTGGRNGAVTFAIPIKDVMQSLAIKGILGGSGPIVA